MDTEMGETGEGAEEVKHANSELGGAKLNGDMNGAYDDEPMDVSGSSDIDEQQSPLKKISSNVGEDKESSIDSVRTGSESVEGSADVPISEVPKIEQKDSDNVSRNGYDHDDNLDKVRVEQGGDNRVSDDEEDDMDCEDVVANNESKIGPSKVSDSDIDNNGLGDKRQNSADSNRIDRPKDKVDGNPSVKPEVDIIKLPKVDSKQLNKDDCDDVSKVNELDRSESEKPKEDMDDRSDNNDDLDKEDFSDDRSEHTVIDIDITPEKSKKSRKSMPINVTPRRSSRNLNKQKSYIEKDERDVAYADEDDSLKGDDPDIEEIQPQDPLADIPIDKVQITKSSSKKTTIVVNDTKRLAEIAAGSKNSKGGKKEPTLVIIDTNSILSGRGPVPLSNQHQTVLNTGASLVSGPSRNQNPGYSVLPITLPAQGMYTNSGNLRPSQTSIKPIPIPQPPPVLPTPKPPIVLPSLTDDMYVVEAPSFIVPYVYEKPPIKPLKEFVDKLEEAIKEIRAKLEKEKKEKEELEKKEKEEQDKKEKEEQDKKEKEEQDKKEKEEQDKKEKESESTEQTETDKTVKSDEKEDEVKDEANVSKTTEEKMEVEEGSADKDKEEKGADKVKEGDDKAKVKAADEKDDNDKPKDLTKEKTEKEKDSKPETSETSSQENDIEVVSEKKKPSNSYFDNALGKFFMQIGINLVQEHVQTDLLRSQKRKRDREGTKCAPDVHMAINSLMRTLEFSKENNEPFKMELKKCEFCSFKTESQLVMAHHLETPHMRNYIYRCNFCTLEVRSPHDILFHMEAEHNVRGRLERAPAFHQCPSCPFEDNQKGKLTRHLLSCAKKYRPERNQEPPLDWEPPAKIPRVPRNRPSGMSPGSALYQAAMSGLKQGAQGVGHPLLPKLLPTPNAALGQGILNRGRGRPQLANRYIQEFRSPTAAMAAQQKAMVAQMRPGMVYRPSGSNAQPQVLLPTSYQIAGNQIYQVVGNQGAQGQVPMVGGAPRLAFVPPNSGPSPAPTPVALVSNIAANSNSITIQSSSTSVSNASGSGGGGSSSSSSSSGGGSSSSSKQSGAAAAKLLQQPSISITPLPRQQPSTPPASSSSSSSSSAVSSPQGKPGRPLGSGKATFVICEICDGYIKDLELLRNHMQWIHKVKIHPKMIYNRPPLNCQKCQFRFFTDQGLERHLLGSHGLVTSSMQEAANKGKDGGRCPVCGRVYQWKLLNHVARDHNMSLKPAHLSYKCTVCTATFGMYKQFENHVYSAHSVVAKRVMDKKTSSPSTQQPSTSSSPGDSLLKPLKINDEITIIPQPPRSSKNKSGGPNTRTSTTGSGGSGSGGSSASNSNNTTKGKV